MAEKRTKDVPKRKLIHRLRNKYRLLVINETSYDERMSMMLSPLNVIVVVGLTFMVISGLTLLLLVYTPMKEWIPGYPSEDIRKKAHHAANLADSLARVVYTYDQYNQNLKQVLRGNIPVDSFGFQSFDSTSLDIDFTRSVEDSLLRDRFENQEQFNIVMDASVASKKILETILFFPPMRGSISSKFDPENAHLGVDITGQEDEPILATLEGTVIFSDWTSETGYVIQVVHANNLLSVYKHNSVLLAKVGDQVTAGQPIAIIGNTGELTTGPHLHFELWYQGQPLDPEEFMPLNR
jgi:murein DD-endopeptidase MepM/ murein hydrolase activator NlpD